MSLPTCFDLDMAVMTEVSNKGTQTAHTHAFNRTTRNTTGHAYVISHSQNTTALQPDIFQ